MLEPDPFDEDDVCELFYTSGSTGLPKGAMLTHRNLATHAIDSALTLGLAHRLRIEAGADMFLMPSRYEPFGNVHLEALAAGLPVVASARAGGAEIIADGINGSVVDPLDSRAVTAALERFRQRREDEVAAAARGSAEPYTYAAQVDGFARIDSRSTRATCDFS